MSVNVNGSYTFYGRENEDLLTLQLQSQLDNIGIVINNANAGLTTWDNVKTKVLTVTSTFTAPTLTVTGGDVSLTQAAAGVVFKTPDGTKTYRVYIDNNGVLNTLELT